MSLKNFHMLFIMISIVTAFGFGMWCFFTESGRATTGSRIMGAISFAASVALVVYAVKFLRKLDRSGIE